MEQYIELNSHCIGKSHTENGMQCEDYSLSYSDDYISIAVISDGHGDKNCPRSGTGAKIACETAAKKCAEFWKDHSDIINDTNADSLMDMLKMNIISEWKRSVICHAHENPLADEEIAGVSEAAAKRYLMGEQLEKAYGATLIAVFITNSLWAALQIGDGVCVAVYEGGVYAEPVPEDNEKSYGNHSASLCDANASESFRHYLGTVKPGAVFVASDGVEESFDRSGLYKCFYTASYWMHEGKEAAIAKINELLPQISSGGSGDDVSISAIIENGFIPAAAKQTMRQVYEKVTACENMLCHYSDMSEELENEIIEYRGKINDKLEQIKNAEGKLGILRDEFEALSALLRVKEESVPKVIEKKNAAANKMEEALQYKEKAEAFWKQKGEMLGIDFVVE